MLILRWETNKWTLENKALKSQGRVERFVAIIRNSWIAFNYLVFSHLDSD